MFRLWLGCGGAVALLVLLAAGCARRGEQSPASTPSLHLAGQRVLVLPVQRIPGLPHELRERLDAELLFALGERDARVTWVPPGELRRALQRSPAFAGDPATLPSDPLFTRQHPRAREPLASELRRYSALVDVRLVLLPLEARFARAEGADGSGGVLHFSGTLLDARSGSVIWRGEAARAGGAPDAAVVASAAAALAERLLAVPEREFPR